MGALGKSLLLFVLNWLDAQLTLFWVHTNLATEGNGLMSQLMKVGDAPFLLVKMAVGAFAALILYKCSHLPVARRGMRLALTVYLGLMLIHLATGMSALGWSEPAAVLTYISDVPYSFIAFFS